MESKIGLYSLPALVIFQYNMDVMPLWDVDVSSFILSIFSRYMLFKTQLKLNHCITPYVLWPTVIKLLPAEQ